MCSHKTQGRSSILGCRKITQLVAWVAQSAYATPAPSSDTLLTPSHGAPSTTDACLRRGCFRLHACRTRTEPLVEALLLLSHERIMLLWDGSGFGFGLDADRHSHTSAFSERFDVWSDLAGRQHVVGNMSVQNTSYSIELPPFTRLCQRRINTVMLQPRPAKPSATLHGLPHLVPPAPCCEILWIAKSELGGS